MVLASRAMEDETQSSGIEAGKVKRILVHGANWVGDALMSTAALACIRAAFPQASITALAAASVEGVYRGNRSVDATILYERGGKHRGAAGKRSLSFLIPLNPPWSPIWRKSRYGLAIRRMDGAPSSPTESRETARWLHAIRWDITWEFPILWVGKEQ